MWLSAQSGTQVNTNHSVKMIPKIPWSVGFTMKGVVTNVVMADERINFEFKGWLSMHQIADGTNHIIKMNCERGISATVTPASFVAMTADWGAGSVQNNKNRLFEILEAAAKNNRVVKVSLTEPKIDFGNPGKGLTLRDAKVSRITDADLH